MVPGAGGVVRMVRMLGMQDALTLISQGKRLQAAQALEKGLVHALASSEEDMGLQAKAWIKANPTALDAWLDGVNTRSGKPALAIAKAKLTK